MNERLRVILFAALIQAGSSGCATPGAIVSIGSFNDLAGRYTFSTGAGIDRYLTIWSDGRFEYADGGCFGIYGRATGRCVIEGDRIRFATRHTSGRVVPPDTLYVLTSDGDQILASEPRLPRPRDRIGTGKYTYLTDASVLTPTPPRQPKQK